MAMQIDRAFGHVMPSEKGVVTEDDKAPVDVELLIGCDTRPTFIFDRDRRIIITDDEMFAPLEHMQQFADALFGFGRGEIAEMIDLIIITDSLVPARDQRGIMFLDCREGTMIDADAPRVVEMRIAREEDGHINLPSQVIARMMLSDCGEISLYSWRSGSFIPTAARVATATFSLIRIYFGADFSSHLTLVRIGLGPKKYVNHQFGRNDVTKFLNQAIRHIAVLAAAFFLSSNTCANADPATLTASDAYEIGMEAYIYLYPLVTMDVTRKVTTNYAPDTKPGMGPMNTFHHLREYPSASFREVVRPNFDTLYSIAWLDLTHEPMIVSAPDTHGRYYLLPMLDMWSDVFAVPGKRTSGTEPSSFAVVPPGWNGALPQNVERINAPTPYVWIIGRTQTNGPSDYAAVHEVQDGYKITPLSLWGKDMPAATDAKIDPKVDMKTPPMEQVNKMSAAAYFKYAAELMRTNPPHITDWSIIARMKRLGLEPGKPFDADQLDPEIRAALDRAAADALKLMSTKAPTLARVVNGWQMNTDTMGVYGDYYLKRAIVAMMGLGANQPEDAIYPILQVDSDGKPLMGESRYVLHFTKEDLPPVNAFWSITMYDEAGYQVANSINRFAIGDRDHLAYGADGSLDIYIQHASPGEEKQSNWLPSPASGKLGITMRLYAPKQEALDGRWAPPPVKRVTEPTDHVVE